MAFTQNVNATFVRQPSNGLATISTGSGTAGVTVYTGGTSGTKIVAITVSSCSTASSDVTWGITNGGTFYTMGTRQIVAAAGTSNSLPSYNLLDATFAPLPLDSDGNTYVLLKSSLDTLTVKAQNATIASGLIYIVAQSGDF